MVRAIFLNNTLTLERFGGTLGSRIATVELIIRHAGRAKRLHDDSVHTNYLDERGYILLLFHNRNFVKSLNCYAVKSLLRLLFYQAAVKRVYLVAADDEYLLVDQHLAGIALGIDDSFVDAGCRLRTLLCVQTQAVVLIYALLQREDIRCIAEVPYDAAVIGQIDSVIGIVHCEL